MDDLRQLADISSPATAQIGLSDSCTDSGEAILLSNGSMSFQAQMHFNGAQLVAKNNIDFRAIGNLPYGISAQAGSNITVESNNQFGLCPNDVNNIFTVWYYRLML